MRKFKCDMCEGEFETDEPAIEHQGASATTPDSASVCQDCYERLAERFPNLKD